VGGGGRVVEPFPTKAKKRGLVGTVYVHNVVMSCRRQMLNEYM
jgi:hypothetical protein